MVFSKFDSLSVRPPTPPKDLHDSEPEQDADATLQFLEDPFGEKPVLPRITAAKSVLNTPEQSPSSDISIPPSSGTARKRVNFELQTCANTTKKAIAQSWTPTRSSPLRPLPQTRVFRPLKSILKPSDGTPEPPQADEGAAAHKFKTFAEMLESIVKLLASSERASRLDAYNSLQRTMQAYDKIPDDQALKQKMSLLTQFIRRDIQAASPTGTGFDSQLISQALKLLMALFRITDLIAAMDEEFCSFIVDRIITVASDGAMPKTIVNTHLAVLMQQSFRPKTMTATRVEKIMDVLDTIQERVSGQSVQAYRIRIYRKLIQQRQDIMIKHTERWFKHTVKALVSGQKDINQSALDTALSAAKHIGHDRQVAKSVLSVLNRVRSDGDTLARVLTKELEKMLAADSAALVPQIWAAVTCLLQGSLHSSTFSALKEWLEVFEQCFASNKESVRVHAHVALCFLCYAVNLGPNTTSGWTKICRNVTLSQLQNRQIRTPVRKTEGDAITAGYITTLYYAFRPNAPFEQYDRYWEDLVVRFWSSLLQSSQHALAACRIVSALLNGSRKPWNEHRVLDFRPQCMVQRGELPLLDPRWVRKSLHHVLQFLELLVDATPWVESEQCEDAPLRTMWLAVLDSLVEASSKEVMASSETKDAIAHIVNMLRRIWDIHTTELANSQQKEDIWAKKFSFLVGTIIQKLGAARFADKCLTRNADQDFEVASTPSHRSKQHVLRTSPLLYLLDLFINQSEGKVADSVRLRVVKLALEPCLDVQSTRMGKLELLRDCAASLDTSTKSSVVSDFWTQSATLLQGILRSVPDASARVAQAYGKEYDIVVELLRLGAPYLLDNSQLHDFLTVFIETVRTEVGDGAVVLAITEKVSARVIKPTPEEEKSACLPIVNILLRNLPKQLSRRILDLARQTLWPASPANGRTTDFDPYNHLYGAIVSVGSAAYRSLDSDNVASTKAYFTALSFAIQNTPTSHLAVFLKKIQDVIGLWVEDPERKLHSEERPLKDLHKKAIQLWGEINRAIERLPRKDTQILLHLETLITAGFLSKRRGIVNSSIATWNKTFGEEETLRYPPRLEAALRRLQKTVDLKLPSLQIETDGSDGELLFYSSDTSTEDVETAFKSPRVRKSPFPKSRQRQKSMSRSPVVPSPANRRVPGRQTPKIRLRHDDSQIQFEPIVSSPSHTFDQESQILTERQQEMAERQMLTTGLFANMGATSPQLEVIVTPMEFMSDAPSADDYTSHVPRATPLKALASMGPMDAFLGSSPTPHARKTTRRITNEDSGLATPTTRRTRKMAQEDALGSSPPKFDKDALGLLGRSDNNILVGSSSDYQQPEESFDDGTTIDEEAFLAAERKSHPEPDFPDDTIMSELPSSTIDSQLNAQIDADMETHTADEDTPRKRVELKSKNDFVDAASHQVSPPQDGSASGAELSESQPLSPRGEDATRASDAATSSTSRVGDSFSRSTPVKRTPKPEVHSLRRSSRNSTGGSPAQPSSAKKRKQTPGKKNKKETPQAEPTEKPTPEKHQIPAEDEDMSDNIVVASPAKKQGSSKKRKCAPDTMPVMVPETNSKRGIRRSQSLLSQVENSQDIRVEDMPAPKRARQSFNQDVSEAKGPPPQTRETQSKRLSHVQVTPRASARTSRVSNEGLPVPSAAPEDTEKAKQTSQESTSESQKSVSATVRTPSRSFAERVILTPRSIIEQLRTLKNYLFSAPQLVLGREEEREIDDALFDIRRQVHAAGLRGEDKPAQ